MRRRRGLLTILLLLALILPARAAETDLWDRVDTQALEEQAENYLETELTPDIDLDEGLSQLGATALEQLGALLTRATRSGGLMLVIALFCALVQAVCPETGQGIGAARLVAALAVTGVALSDVSSLLELGRETVVKLSDFTKILIPVMTTAAAASGSVTGAAARQMATLFCSNLLLSLIERVLIPMIYLYIAACAGALASGNRGIHAIADFIKWGAQSLLTWVLTLFTLYLSLSGVISGTADRAAVKLTRFAISGMVPVVGGILSDATESVLAGAGLLRSAVGTFGTLAVLAFCLVPFLKLGIQYLLYKLAAVLASVLTDSPVAKLVGEIGGAFGLMLGMVGASALVTLISVILTIGMAVS